MKFHTEIKKPKLLKFSLSYALWTWAVSLLTLGGVSMPHDVSAQGLYPELPEEFIIARPPAGMETSGVQTEGIYQSLTTLGKTERTFEKPSVFNGDAWTVIYPLHPLPVDIDPSQVNSSFLRILNGADGIDRTVTVRVVGQPSADIYGEGTIVVPPNASPQYSRDDLLEAANAGALVGGDTNYAVYLQSDAGTAFQHVIYNSGNGFFENMSNCRFRNKNYSGLNSLLMNVHTTLLDGYPSVIFLHNYFNESIDYEVNIHDARTGTQQGLYNFSVGANTTYAVSMEFFQGQIGWTPNSNQQHANLFFVTQNPNGSKVIAHQAIFNQDFGSWVNMTQFCELSL